MSSSEDQQKQNLIQEKWPLLAILFPDFIDKYLDQCERAAFDSSISRYRWRFNFSSPAMHSKMFDSLYRSISNFVKNSKHPPEQAKQWASFVLRRWAKLSKRTRQSIVARFPPATGTAMYQEWDHRFRIVLESDEIVQDDVRPKPESSSSASARATGGGLFASSARLQQFRVSDEFSQKAAAVSTSRLRHLLMLLCQKSPALSRAITVELRVPPGANGGPPSQQQIYDVLGSVASARLRAVLLELCSKSKLLKREVERSFYRDEYRSRMRRLR